MLRLVSLAATAIVLVAVACDGADTEAPTVSIVSPVDGSSVNRGDVVIRAVATDNKGVSCVEFFVDDTLVGSANTPTAGDTFECEWSDTASQVVGQSYDLFARAHDAAGNARSSSTVTMTIIGAAGPEVAIVYPGDGATIGPGSTSIKAVATDDSGIARVEFFDDSTMVGDDTAGVADTFSVAWTAGKGLHVLRAVATNRSGGTASDTITVTVAGGTGPTHHAGQLDTNEVWYAWGNPHVLDSDVWTGKDVTLTIMPGCLVQFAPGVELYTGFVQPGAIIAVGSADSMITFTSLSDTAAGAWRQLGFYRNTMPTARLYYVAVEYAGGDGAAGAVYVSGCGITMDHCALRRSATVGLCCASRGYLYSFSDNTITASGAYPVRIDADCVWTFGTGNVLTGNASDAILVNGQNVKTTGTWLNQGVPYVVDGDIDVSDATSAPVLTLAAGTTVKLQPQGEFRVGNGAPGGLICDGTSGQITFTSSVSSPGAWSRLSFYPQALSGQCQLENCRIEYGGYDGHGDIYIDNCTPTITGCDIGYSSAYGIYLNGVTYPDPTDLRNNNTFHDCASGDVREP
ncbi:hypothetical protein JXD38_00595 [candidate division WOR-3 bacterium]|nr:hypothetical protein [candidate division WOR-3 bacterium]